VETRAIIVDDEAATCELIRKVLSSVGMESLALTKELRGSGNPAARKIRGGLPDITWTPDGPALARQMRASGSNRLTRSC